MTAGGSGPLVHHPEIGAKVRAGAYGDHAASTYALAEAAVREGRGADAAELARYTVQEALEAYELFTAWNQEIPDFLAGRGVAPETVAAEAARLAELLAGPDGSAFDGDAGWARYRQLIEAFAAAAAAGLGDPQVLDEARAAWRDTHDRLCDGVYFWIDAAARHLGEAVVGDLWDALMAPMYDYYVRYDIDRHPWSRSFDLLMHYALEGLRGHLSGPGRTGSVEVVEEADRWAIRFDPCGSGGRTMRDDPDTGTGPRIEAPWYLGVTQEAHDWSWNRKGVCLYCVHCCQLNERMPMRRFGYPTRVVEPPVWPEARAGTKCTWYVYKDPALVPDEVYRRVGATKPAVLGGRAVGRHLGEDHTMPKEEGHMEASFADRAVEAMCDGRVDLVQMEVPDLNGALRGKFVAAGKVAGGSKSAICTVLYQFTPVDDVWASEHSSYENGFPDVLGVPDLSTAIELPWRQGMAAVIYDVHYPNGAPFPLAPRNVLKRVAGRFAQTGYAPMFGVEFEAFVFHADREALAAGRHHDLVSLGRMHNAYRLTESEEARELGAEFIRRMRGIGITVEVFHTELGLGAIEFALAPADALAAADNAIRAKTYFRELCAERGLAATFMAKWRAEDSGCGAHVHQSVWKDGHNLFHDADTGKFSGLGHQYMAGMLASLQDCGVIFRPTVNSFRRFNVLAWCPENVSWGYDNRSAALRVIAYPEPKAYRIEHRVPGADVNPYLSLAAMLAGGHHGIANNLVPPEAAQGNALKGGDRPRLADNLGAATELFAGSAFCRDYFGDAFVDHYAASRRAELQYWNEWLASQVTAFELSRYFETS